MNIKQLQVMAAILAGAVTGPVYGKGVEPSSNKTESSCSSSILSTSDWNCKANENRASYVYDNRTALEKTVEEYAQLFGVSKELVEQFIEKNADEIMNYPNIQLGLFVLLSESQTNELEQMSHMDTLSEEDVAFMNAKADLTNLNIGSRYDKERVDAFKQTEAGKLYIKYGNMYGIDPDLLIAKATQESNLDHEGHINNGPAIGIEQLEKPDGGEIRAYNYETKEWDVELFSKAEATDLETNIRYGVKYMQMSLVGYQYNPYVALQGYNFSSYVLTETLDKTAAKENVSKDEMLSNFQDTTYIRDIQYVSANPSSSNFIVNVANMDYETYGDGNYISNVLSYFGKDNCWFDTPDGRRYINLKLGVTKVINSESSDLKSELMSKTKVLKLEDSFQLIKTNLR